MVSIEPDLFRLVCFFYHPGWLPAVGWYLLLSPGRFPAVRWYLRKGSCLGSNTVATNSVFRCGWPIGFDALIPWRDQSPGQVVYLFRKRACPRRKHFNFTEHLSGGQQVAAAVSMSSVAGCFITFHPIYCTCPTCPAPTFSCITHTRDHIAGTPPSPLPTAMQEFMNIYFRKCG